MITFEFYELVIMFLIIILATYYLSPIIRGKKGTKKTKTKKIVQVQQQPVPQPVQPVHHHHHTHLTGTNAIGSRVSAHTSALIPQSLHGDQNREHEIIAELFGPSFQGRLASPSPAVPLTRFKSFGAIPPPTLGTVPPFTTDLDPGPGPGPVAGHPEPVHYNPKPALTVPEDSGFHNNEHFESGNYSDLLPKQSHPGYDNVISHNPSEPSTHFGPTYPDTYRDQMQGQPENFNQSHHGHFEAFSNDLGGYAAF